MKPYAMTFATTTLIAAGLSYGSTAHGSTIGAAITDGADNFLTQTIDADLTVGGDMFGIRSRTNAGTPGLPFAIADDSVSIFAADTQGFIAENDNAPFLGIVDNVSGSSPDFTADSDTAVWTFDISGYVDLGLSIDLAAMGDFEDGVNDSFPSFPDGVTIRYQIDGGAFSNFVTTSVDFEGNRTYTMDGGATVSLDDPMSAIVNGVSTELTESFGTFSKTIAGSGSILTVELVGGLDGGSEAFAARNLLVTGVVPEPSSLALLGLGGLLIARRRRG